MNCKPNDWAMVIAVAHTQCPFCSASGQLDLRPQAVHVTHLVAIEPRAMWAIEHPIVGRTISFPCGTTVAMPAIDALPDAILQPLPKMGEEEDQPAAHSLPKVPEVTP